MNEKNAITNKRYWSLVDDLAQIELGNTDASVAEWKGEKALHLKQYGAAAFINEEIPFQAFRIQAYVAVPDKIGFVGLVFGARDEANYELLYLSPGDGSGMGEAYN